MTNSDKSVHMICVALLFLLLTSYCVVSLRHLAVVPPVYEDEPSPASTGWKLSCNGVLGSDLFAGFAGVDDNSYGRMGVLRMSPASDPRR